MTRAELENISINELQEKFKQAMIDAGFAENSLSTYQTQAFYIYRNFPNVNFKELVFSSDCQDLSRKYLKNVQYPDGYVSNLKRLHDFIIDGKLIKNETKVNKKNDVKKIPKPCVEQAKIYLKKWDELDDYVNQEIAINKIIALCPNNDNITDILVKSAMINQYYSTRIVRLYDVAKVILKLGVDERLALGDYDIVNEIAGHCEKDYYSFVTKYCSFHNQNAYAIYDSFVDNVLWYFKDDIQYDFKRNDLRNYKIFIRVINCFISEFGLEQFSLKEIDRYLWQLGKEYFPRGNK